MRHTILANEFRGQTVEAKEILVSVSPCWNKLYPGPLGTLGDHPLSEPIVSSEELG